MGIRYNIKLIVGFKITSSLEKIYSQDEYEETGCYDEYENVVTQYLKLKIPIICIQTSMDGSDREYYLGRKLPASITIEELKEVENQIRAEFEADQNRLETLFTLEPLQVHATVNFN